jgi:ParB/RepB/Spo0J family partition protein
MINEVAIKEARIPIENIIINPDNPRKRFDETRLQELAASIKEVGILQPLVVTDSEEEGKYLLIAGERRLRAAKMAGLKFVPVVYRIGMGPMQQACMLIENLQREDLDPIEEARAFRILTQDHGWKQTDLAAKLGVSQAHIANRIRLLQLPEAAQDAISQGKLTASAGKELATLVKIPAVSKFLEKAAEEGESSEYLVHQAKYKAHEAARPLHKQYYPEPKFNLKTCEQCKERIMLPDRWGNSDRKLPHCLNVKCWEEKQKEAEEEAAEKARQQALSTGKEIVELSDLPGGSYRHLSYSKEFDQTDCQDCEHNRYGKSRHMDEPINICLNPSCFNAKKAAADKEARRREKELKAAFDERKEDMIATFDPRAIFDVDKDTPDFHALVYMAIQAIHHPPWSSSMSKAKIEAAVYERYGWKKPEGLSWSEEEKHLVQLLSTLTTEELLRLMLFVMLKPVEHDDRTFNAVFGEFNEAPEAEPEVAAR